MRRSVSLRFWRQDDYTISHPDDHFGIYFFAVDLQTEAPMNFSILLLAFLIFAISLVAAVTPGPPMPAPLAPEVPQIDF